MLHARLTQSSWSTLVQHVLMVQQPSSGRCRGFWPSFHHIFLPFHNAFLVSCSSHPFPSSHLDKQVNSEDKMFSMQFYSHFTSIMFFSSTFLRKKSQWH